MTETLTARDGSTYTAEQAEDGTWSIPDFPVFADGIWKGSHYSAERVDVMIGDTNAALEFVRPQLGIGHEKDENHTTLPSFGRFSELKRKGAFVISTLSKIPAAVFAAIKAGQYGPVSVETRPFRNPKSGKLGEIVYAVRFLGLVPPEVATIAPATEFSSAESTALSWSDWTPFSALIDGVVSAPTVEAVCEGDPNPDASTEGDSPVSEDTAKAREDALAKEREEFERQKTALEAERKSFEESRRTAFSAEVAAKFDNLVQTSRAKPAEKESWERACNAIGPNNPIAFSALCEAWASRAEIRPSGAKPAGAEGDNTEPSDVRLYSAVLGVMKDRGIKTYGEAAAIVEREHPELVDANRKQFACDRATPSDSARLFSAIKE
jgi:hypothetical protein